MGGTHQGLPAKKTGQKNPFLFKKEIIFITSTSPLSAKPPSALPPVF
jgi:hypothetical protein